MQESMHPFQHVSDILLLVEHVHQNCWEQFETVAVRCTDMRRRALLSYLAEREAEQLNGLRRLQGSDDDALKSCVQSVPASSLTIASEPRDTGGTIDEVVQHYSLRDQALMQLYTQLADSVGPRAATIFHNLLKMREYNQERLRTALLDF